MWLRRGPPAKLWARRPPAGVGPRRRGGRAAWLARAALHAGATATRRERTGSGAASMLAWGGAAAMRVRCETAAMPAWRRVAAMPAGDAATRGWPRPPAPEWTRWRRQPRASKLQPRGAPRLARRSSDTAASAVGASACAAARRQARHGHPPRAGARPRAARAAAGASGYARCVGPCRPPTGQAAREIDPGPAAWPRCSCPACHAPRPLPPRQRWRHARLS